MNIMDILYVPFGYVMKGCLWISQNRFWIAIIFFSLIMEAVLLPLSIKQQKASVKQQKLKPMEIAIRRKYKGQNDKVTQQKCNMEIQEMYQKNGYNAFAGCLPLLIQFPIIIALYAIVRNPMQYTLFMNDADIDVMYADSIVLCEQVKDGLEEDLAALVVTDGEPESETSSSGAAAYTDPELAETIESAINTFTGYQKKMCDRYIEKDGVYSFYIVTDGGCYVVTDGKYDLSASDAIPSDAVKSVREEYIAVSLTKHFDRYVREALSEYGLCGSLLENSDEIILKNAFGYTASPVYYEAIKNLPDYEFLGMSLLDKPSFFSNISWLIVVPLLVFITSFGSMYVSRKLQPQNVDADGNPVKMPGGKFMEWGMPLMSLYFAANFQAAIGVYWVWRTLFSTGKQILLSKMYPLPVVTEEDIKEAQKQFKTSRKKKKIVIEVDEDDHSYDNIKVSEAESAAIDRTGRKIKMLGADDDDDPPVAVSEADAEGTDKEQKE